jgi:glycosyltransferase involved in cell wall biosynthesis
VSDSPHFHLWIPELNHSKGGIQVYSAHFLQAIAQLYPSSRVDVFLKHDRSGQCRSATSDRNFNRLLSEPIPLSPPYQGGCQRQGDRIDRDRNWNQHQAMRFHRAGDVPLFLRTPAFAAQLLTQGIWQRPDLIITTHLNFAVVAAQLKRLTGIPYWTVAHGIEAWNLTNRARQMALQNADRILAVSPYTRDRLLKEQALDPAKVVVLPNTLDATRFQIQPKPVHLLQRYQLTANQPLILTVCRLAEAERYKGYDQILAALSTIRRAIPTVHYLIVGKGKDRDRIEQLIIQLDLQDCVTLTGFVPDEELCDYYNLCNVLAMPSKREGFGIVYLEAMACGKPVLGGNQDGAVDALAKGKLGGLVNPDDVEAIAQTLIQMLQGTYPNVLMHQPHLLRDTIIETFGLERFTATLDEHLTKYFASHPVLP